jgi:hypothetical protein
MRAIKVETSKGKRRVAAAFIPATMITSAAAVTIP